MPQLSEYLVKATFSAKVTASSKKGAETLFWDKMEDNEVSQSSLTITKTKALSKKPIKKK